MDTNDAKEVFKVCFIFSVTYGGYDTNTVLVVSRYDLGRRIQTQTDDKGQTSAGSR